MQLCIFIVTFHGKSIIFCMVWRQNQNLSMWHLSCCGATIFDSFKYCIKHTSSITVDFTKLLPKYSKFCYKVRKFVAKFKSSY